MALLCSLVPSGPLAHARHLSLLWCVPSRKTLSEGVPGTIWRGCCPASVSVSPAWKARLRYNRGERVDPRLSDADCRARSLKRGAEGAPPLFKIGGSAQVKSGSIRGAESDCGHQDRGVFSIVRAASAQRGATGAFEGRIGDI